MPKSQSQTQFTQNENSMNCRATCNECNRFEFALFLWMRANTLTWMWRFGELCSQHDFFLPFDLDQKMLVAQQHPVKLQKCFCRRWAPKWENGMKLTVIQCCEIEYCVCVTVLPYRNWTSIYINLLAVCTWRVLQ